MVADAHRVTTIKALLDLFASTDQIAARLGVTYATVTEWHRLGRIPESHWDRFVTAARDAGIKGVSRNLLARLPSAKGVSTVAELLSLWPTIASLARDLGLHHSTVGSWAVRNSIPVERWSGVVMSARSHGIGHLTESRLQAIAEARRAIRQGAALAGGQTHEDDSSLSGVPARHDHALCVIHHDPEHSNRGVTLR